MPTFFLAPSLDKLRDQINERWPNRDKTSDGWIGDPAHSARISDHNPDYSDGGIVRALDVDINGINVDELLAAVVGAPRVAYIIFNRRIWTHAKGWQTYTGPNPHTGHIHISIAHNNFAEARATWNLGTIVTAQAVSSPTLSKSIKQLAEEVIEGRYGSGDERRAILGSRYAAVQTEVNRQLTEDKTSQKAQAKSISQLADEVIDGKHGVGEARKRVLGSRYDAVQAEVNRKLKGSSGRRVAKTINQLADEVIAGKHGSGTERKKSLGAKYNSVQAEVNKRLN